MYRAKHEGMWFNPELPGYHGPGCRASINLERLANVPKENRTEHAHLLLADKHQNPPPSFLELPDGAQQERVGNPLKHRALLLGNSSSFFSVVTYSG